MTELSIRVVVDASSALDAVALLTWAVDLSPQFRQRLIDLGNLGPELVRVDLDIHAATAADELRLRLDPSDALADLARAVRAGEFDDLVV